jgi:hypothetical protein
MGKVENKSASALPRLVERLLLQGWVSIAIWMSFGLLLEGLLGYKIPAFLEDGQRRELFRLAHTHGTLLSLVLVAAALCVRLFEIRPPAVAVAALRLGAVLMPLGFLLGGIWHPEGDPGVGIWLVPPGALMVIFGAIATALASRKKASPTD